MFIIVVIQEFELAHIKTENDCLNTQLKKEVAEKVIMVISLPMSAIYLLNLSNSIIFKTTVFPKHFRENC